MDYAEQTENQAAAAKTARFTKISATGEQLPADGIAHVAVIDSRTGLIWAAIEAPRAMSQPKCAEFCAQLELAGHKDWRLPTRAELLTLVDDTRVDPAIDTDAFPGCKSRWYWTSTPWAASPGDYAWGVNFDDGDAGYGDRDGFGFVRAVRVGQ